MLIDEVYENEVYDKLNVGDILFLVRMNSRVTPIHRMEYLGRNTYGSHHFFDHELAKNNTWVPSKRDALLKLSFDEAKAEILAVLIEELKRLQQQIRFISDMQEPVTP